MDDVGFYLPIASIVVFVFALFGIYRTLVSQKDAAIQALEKENGFLKLQLVQAKLQSPDVVAQALASRIALLSEELSRLESDTAVRAEAIKDKQCELERAKSELDDLRAQVARAEHLFSDFSCPKCKALMDSREQYTQVVQYMDDGVDIEHEIIRYRCGYEMIDGAEVASCGS